MSVNCFGIGIAAKVLGNALPGDLEASTKVSRKPQTSQAAATRVCSRRRGSHRAKDAERQSHSSGP